MSRLRSILRLTRVEHSIMLVVAVVAAELLAGGIPSPLAFLLSLITPVFISMGSFAINDYYDIKVDKLNKKERPLVDGSLMPRDALWVSGACFGIGVAASLFINTYAFAIAAIFAILSFLYSYLLKEVFFLGNAYVALSMVIPFIYGNFVVSASVAPSNLLVGAMVFFSGLAREIHGTVRDYKGDVKARKVKTLPRVIGMRASSMVALLLYLLAILLSIYLYVAVAPFKQSMAYAILIALSDLMLLYVGVGYITKRKRVQEFYESTRYISLFAMAAALVAILVPALFHI